jgi:hypothetical protein
VLSTTTIELRSFARGSKIFAGREVKLGRTLASTSPRDEIKMSPLLLPALVPVPVPVPARERERPKTGDHECPETLVSKDVLSQLGLVMAYETQPLARPSCAFWRT